MKLSESWGDRDKRLEKKYHNVATVKFAYLPTRINDGSVIWLESYISRTLFCRHSGVWKIRYPLEK